MSDIPIKITVETRDVSTAARKAERELDKLEKDAKKTGKSIGKDLTSGFSALKATITGIGTGLAAWGLTAIAKNILEVNMRFQDLTSQLTTFLGDAALAKDAFAAIKAWAAPLPITVTEATEAFTKMVALGLRPTERALTSFGDIALGANKDLMQLIEAVADAATGEFERLKEFGIKASQQGDKVTFTFKGVQTTVKKSANAIVEYLTKIGETDFAGGMANRAKNVSGALSVLGSAWDNFADSLLNDTSMSYIAELITALADHLENFRRGLVTLPNYWNLAWQTMELTFYKFYENVAPYIDKLFELIGKDDIDGLKQVEIVSQRIANVEKEMRENAKDALSKIGAGEARKKLDEFIPAAKKASGATEDLKAAAKRAKEQLAAQDKLMKLLNPDTAGFAIQIRSLTADYEKGYLTQEQYNKGLEKLNKLQAEAAGAQGREDRSLVLGYIDPDLDAYETAMDKLNDAYERGTISQDQYAQATEKVADAYDQAQLDKAADALAKSTDFADGATRAFEKLTKQYNDGASAIETAITGAFNSAGDSLTEFITTGSADFTDMVDSIIADLVRMSVQQQILAPITSALSASSTGDSSSSTANWVTSAIGSLGSLMGFVSGGSFEVSKASSVGSTSGVDNRLIAFRAQDGEQVSVTKKGQSAAGSQVNMTVVAQDAQSFSQSQSQIMARMGAAISRADKRNN